MMRLDQYSKVKDNYCLCYFGYSDEYLVQLRLLKPIIEKKFKGLNVCFGCKDDKAHLLKGCEPVLKASEIKAKRHMFAHIRELKYHKLHPVEELMKESEITNFAFRSIINPPKTNICTIVKDSSYPTTPLTSTQIEQVQQMVSKEGFEPVISHDWENVGWVVGVESVPLFEAAARGTRTTLIPTGVGLRLYETMFPNAEVLHR